MKVFKLGSNVIKFHFEDDSFGLKETKLRSRETSELVALVLTFPLNFLIFKDKGSGCLCLQSLRNFFEVLCCALIFVTFFFFLPEIYMKKPKTK